MDSQESSDSESGSEIVPLHRRKRAISSSSDSSSSSIGATRLIIQRKRFCGQFNLNDSESDDNPRQAVIAETSDSDSSVTSGSSTPCPRRRYRNRPIAYDSTASSSDSNNTPENLSTATRYNAIWPAEPSSPQRKTEESDSGDDTVEKCAICLRGIRAQEVGSPEGCDHTFCLTCLVQWSKSCNKCPMDRQQFKLILVRDSLHGEVVRQLPVDENTLEVNEEDSIFCIICRGFDGDDTMLLCDGCDRGFHLQCLNPPLTAVPDEDEWYCPSCTAWRQVSGQLGISYLNPREDSLTVIYSQRTPRTYTTSARILRNNLLTLENDVFQPSTSLGSSPTEGQPGSSGTQPTRRTRTTTTRRRTKKRSTRRTKPRRRLVLKKRKILVTNDDGTVSEEVISEYQIFRRRKTRRKKKSKKRPRTNRRRAAPATITRSSVRNRIARSLGMVAPSTPGRLLPQVSSRRRAPSRIETNFSRAMGGIPTLNIFEPRNELAPVSSESDGERMDGDGEVGLLSRTRVGLSTRPIERRKAVELLRAPARPRPPPQPCEGPIDLLSSILESQTIWHSKNSNVTVNMDGSVELRPNSKVDVRNGTLERAAAAAPVSPSSGSQPGSMPAPPTDVGSSPSSAAGSSNSAPATAASSSPRMGMPHNDREGYTNFFNNMPPRPTPFCRGGPPLRFRMFVRPPLRRIPLLPRRNPRPLYDEVEDMDEELDGIAVDDVERNETNENPEDLDLYSDIEPNVVEKDGEHSEEEVNFPELGPPPEPPQFLLNFSMTNDRNESDVYDPAEPCDSDEELVIAEPQTEVMEEIPIPSEVNLLIRRSPTPPPSATEDCPVLRLYSSDSVAYSRKGEEERARELEESKLMMQKSPEEPISLPSSPKEKVGTRLSFNVECPSSAEESQDWDIGRDKVDSCPDEGNADENALNPPQNAESVASDAGSGMQSPHSEKPPRCDRRSRNSRESRSGSRSPASDLSGRHRRLSTNSHRRSFSSDNDKSSKINRSRKSSVASENKSRSPKNRNESPPLNYSGSPRDQNDVPRVSTGLEGLDVEEVSSDMEDNDFNLDDDRLSSLSLSGLSDHSRRSPTVSKKKKRKKKRIKEKTKTKGGSEEGEVDSDKSKKTSKNDDNVVDENKSDSDKKNKRNRSKSASPGRQILASKENKKSNKGAKDFAWKKPSRKEKNYREGRKLSKERVRNKDGRSSRSPSPRRGKKKSKDRKRIDKDKKKEIERYDVRKIVKNKEVRKKDAFGRDLPSKSLSLSKSPSKSRSRSRVLSRPRRNSRSPSHSPARGFRRGRRRFRTISRSPSLRRNKKRKSIEREGRKNSRSRQQQQQQQQRSKRRSASRSPRPIRVNRQNKKEIRGRKSWSRSLSLSSAPRSPTPPRMRNDFAPSRIRRSISPERIRHSLSRSWSRGISPPRDPSLENLTVVLTSKDKKRKKRRKDDKRLKKNDSKKKKTGNSKEVFASGDNVLVSVNFNRTSKNSNVPVIIPDISPVREVSKKKRRANADDGRTSKKSKASNVSKTVVDAALSGQGPKRKKLTRLTEADAEEILNRKPVAVIDLDISPYREQTPSPINVVVVSDSGSGEEGKAPSPPRTRSPDIVVLQPPATANTQYTQSSGPKTPPEPPLKFSISKPAQLRPIANPLAEPDEDNEESPDATNENVNNENQYKGPNTPPEPRGPSTPPRGPSTPKSPSSPQTSPDAYDPFEPTKSRSPSPLPAPTGTLGSDSALTVDTTELNNLPVAKTSVEDNAKSIEIVDVSNEDVRIENDSNDLIKDGNAGADVIEITSQGTMVNKSSAANKKTTTQPLAPGTGSTLPLFSLASPNKSSSRPQNVIAASGIQRLQHRLGSPVNKTPNSIKLTPEKRGPELLSTGNFKVRNAAKRNGPLQDATNETVEMDDSPYSPDSCEGDDLFDPPPTAPTVAATAPSYKTKNTPVKSQNKFDMLFGASGNNLSPMKNGAKKLSKGGKAAQKTIGGKASKKGGKKGGAALKMDEDQLRILDEVPSSAVELQVKDKFLKKLNRQERVVDEVKTVLKPHYARKHITKDEYKEILRRAVPKICHSKSGEINPSKIQHLVEAYVRKYRHNKKKGTGGVQKPKLKKTTMFS